MDMQISLSFETPESPVRHLDDMPIYPMAHEVSLAAEFINVGTDDLNIQDPNTSVYTLACLQVEETGQEVTFRLNPVLVDITGERTMPPSDDVLLRPQESISAIIELNKYIPDRCFLPGKYGLYVKFQEYRSSPLRYGVEYRPESVPELIEIALDDTTDSWIREEAFTWLRKLPEGPGIEPAAENESEAEKADRETRNRENAELFLERWPVEKETETVMDFFENSRLRQ